MLTPAFANITSFFYPIGNTPAVSLTQNLPPEGKADILLLGCGDVRHILFTAHTDREFQASNDQSTTYTYEIVDRKLDVTCCDVEKAVIGASISCFTLLTDWHHSPECPSTFVNCRRNKGRLKLESLLSFSHRWSLSATTAISSAETAFFIDLPEDLAREQVSWAG